MVEKESQSQRRGHRRRDDQFDERYLGLSRAEVALRERMAKKFGRQAQHLEAKKQPAVEEQKVPDSLLPGPLIPQEQFQAISQKDLQQPRVDPSTKLRQLKMDNERYRASIESGHQLLQTNMGEPAREAASQAAQDYQYKFMKPAATLSASLQSSQGNLHQDRQNSRVSESAASDQFAPASVSEATHSYASPSPSLQKERCRKNLQLLQSIFSDYSEEELSREIFTLQEVSLTSNKSASQNDALQSSKQSRKLQKQKQSTSQSDQMMHRGAQQPTGSSQIILNEKQFNLIKKVYPQAFHARRSAASFGQQNNSSGNGSDQQLCFHDPQLIIQLFANMQALYKRTLDHSTSGSR